MKPCLCASSVLVGRSYRYHDDHGEFCADSPAQVARPRPDLRRFEGRSRVEEEAAGAEFGRFEGHARMLVSFFHRRVAIIADMPVAWIGGPENPSATIKIASMSPDGLS